MKPVVRCVRFAASLLLVLALSVAAPRMAAAQGSPGGGDRAGERDVPSVTVPVDTAVTSTHSITMADGREIPYSATLGFLPVYDDDGDAVASLFYTYYRRTDVQETGRRPLTFSFNGGPGSASLWMHLGYTGPRRLRISDEGFPVQPYGVRPNPHTILDATDIVYVNPVNTGFSRALPGVEEEQFFGVDDDVAYLADWIDLFVSREERWDSPKYLIGESYGTTRVSGLAGELQDGHWMSLNGVILVSPTGLGIDRDGPVSDALSLPHYAATAWYHDRLAADLQEADLPDLLAEVEEFTLDEYLPALARGGSLGAERKSELAGTVARYAGVGREFVLDHNLSVPISPWRKELMREQGFTVGRLDARYRGVDRSDAGDRYDYDPALAAWNHAFAPAINEYVREELGLETDLQYNVFGPVYPWEREGNDTGEQLRGAMAANPFLKVMVQSGYYDGGTDYFSAQYTMWQMDPSGRLQDRMRFEAYRSGHMMYLRTEDLATSNQDIREFIDWSMPEEGDRAGW